MSVKHLPNIQSPADIKDFSIDELREVCDELRSHIIETITETGGHLAPTLGVIELTVALHYIYEAPKDKIIWDVGHQAYAHKLLTGRYDRFSTIRQFKGISGFLKRTESEYDVFGAGHASTSISAGLGIAAGRDHNGDDFRIASIIGDGSMSGGLAFEGINNAGHLRKQLLVILNDNEMSISPNVGAMHHYLTRIVTNPVYNRIRDEIWNITGKLPYGKSTSRSVIKKIEESIKSLLVPGILFDELGFRYMGPINGHDLDEVVHTLNNIKDIKTPILLHVLTKKGKGMNQAENDPINYHGVKPNGKNKPVVEKNEVEAPSFQSVFGALAIEIARNQNETVCVTAAMREGTGLAPYAKEFPERYYDVGIAEGHAVTFAGGLATEKTRPILAIYSTFLQRAFDHIVHDIAIQNLPLIYCLDRSGLAGEDGPTHHGTLDIAYMRCIQNMVVTAPKNGNEFRHLLYTALNQSNKPFSIRYPKASSVEFDEKGQAELLPLGSWEVLNNGSDVAILAVGPIVYTALDVANELAVNNIKCEVVNCRFIKPMDTQYLETLVNNFSTVITIEEGNIVGGFGDGVSSWLLENGFKGTLKRLGLPDKFVEHGSRKELLNLVGLTQSHISNTVKKQLQKQADNKPE
ncbi:MAG: 1-deoxy-D-xylulose-5-phosphate synthase [Candidatus Marinimicrobia bacterium]|jgi:1-deoxy-D-xylulose-5-phosphate synthase|nr:1-deoxy-D-xylulose-5-phosphate synthase [Candidatus Neomarinimicrobiota bacterium]MBT3961875.1 1-deoxy-D-xylulose-5-phosphate synthase [Candidatus Neomarinimicrobiota bacterium]MBT4382703.1 1-deoxy-D-xylulose-5-phosphate synthase [Candidatus Neomarinimicrobiota bacterium]MBT4636677.1 1-deoxy-D-xylulose-5-phosphate synthase [Candidatus Neomarinimicrobiota bacterium]MBT4685362.1 1-deoxy-D-xylulose-5-phosphate synthase [Candidatus Neomarinimicrobiota bacterium]